MKSLNVWILYNDFNACQAYINNVLCKCLSVEIPFKHSDLKILTEMRTCCLNLIHCQVSHAMTPGLSIRLELNKCLDL